MRCIHSHTLKRLSSSRWTLENDSHVSLKFTFLPFNFPLSPKTINVISLKPQGVASTTELYTNIYIQEKNQCFSCKYTLIGIEPYSLALTFEFWSGRFYTSEEKKREKIVNISVSLYIFCGRFVCEKRSERERERHCSTSTRLYKALIHWRFSIIELILLTVIRHICNSIYSFHILPLLIHRSICRTQIKWMKPFFRLQQRLEITIKHSAWKPKREILMKANQLFLSHE